MAKANAAVRRLAAMAVAATLVACGDAGKKPAAPAGPVVTVSQPVQREIVDSDEYTGRFGAVDAVSGPKAEKK